MSWRSTRKFPEVLLDLIMENIKEDINIASTSCCLEEGGRGCRNKKRSTDPTCCPVCSITLRTSEVESHLNTEIDKLNKIILSNKHKINGKSAPSSSGSSSTDSTDKNWETFQKVKSNRQSRQRTKSRKRKAEEVTCPICNEETNEDITLHVELCLRKSENNGIDSDESIDVENYEEYEWAGQSRVRATSMLSCGVSSLGTSLSMADEDEDLNVDGDDAQVYGTPQYSEVDVIPPCGDAEDTALRKAVTGADPKIVAVTVSADIGTVATKGDPILQVLKNRIRELEGRERNKDDVYKCLICMERYRTPVISVCCWHVHCEQCWLQTLGAKKLCPQCNMITSPADLRRIYM